MNPSQWFQTGGHSLNDQQYQTNSYGEPKSDRMNYYNMEGIRQNTPNLNFMQSLCAAHRNLIRDPRLRNRMPSNLNSYSSNQIQQSKYETQALSQYPADHQSTFSPFINPSNDKLSENANVDYQKSLQLMQSYHQFLQDMHKKYYRVEKDNWHLPDVSYQKTPSDAFSYDIDQLRCQPFPKPFNNQLATAFANNSKVNQNYNSETDWNNSAFEQNEMVKTEIYQRAMHCTDLYGNYSSYQSVQQNNYIQYHKESEMACQPTVRSTNKQDDSMSRSNNERGSSPNIMLDGNSQLNSENSEYGIIRSASITSDGNSECSINRNTGYDSSRPRNQGFPRRDRERSPSTSLSGHLNAHQRSRSRSRSKQRKCRSRSCSRSRSTSKSKSRYRSKSRSRSKSKGRYRSRSRSRSISKPRSRYRSRSRSTSKGRSRYRSRSRSRSISKSQGRYRSRSRSKTTTRFRSRTRSISLSRSQRQDSSRSYSYGRRTRDQEQEESTFKRMKDQRQKLIEKWRMNNCDTQDEMQKRLQEIFQMNPEEILEEENKVWIRSAPADCYYERDPSDLRRMRATPRLEKLCEKFRYELLERGNRVRKTQNLKCPSPPKPKQKLCKHKSQACSSSSESGSESDESDDVNDMIEELQRKQKHPYRLHPELWYNDPGEMNDGPLCRCSAKARRSGIRHGFYAGENQRFYCDAKSNNAGSLYHYRITISPPTNFLTRTPTIINYDDHEFIFEGFSLISHYPIQKLPTCKVIRFNIEYIILYVEEKLPENFCIEELDLFYNYLFKEVLELVDFELLSSEFPDSCPQFHFMPRFVRELPENGRELLPMCEILKYLLDSNKKLIEDDALDSIHRMTNSEWQNFADLVKGMVVTNPGMKPCSLRVDQLDRDTDEDHKRNSKNSMDRCPSRDRFSREKDIKKNFSDNESLFKVEENFWDNDTKPLDHFSLNAGVETDCKKSIEKREALYPEIVHFGIRPPQLSYAGNPEYQKAWRKYVKFRHLLANMPKPTAEDKQKLAAKENRLHSMRAHSKMKRDVTVTVSSKGFYLTGLMCDVVQHAMLIPVLVCHLRFHRSLLVLEDKIGYQFKNRFLLQLALTHPSYRENFGTNSDHARNSLTNCGIRQPKYGDRRIHYMNTRKRGINTLISIMSRFGKKNETQSNIYHNERLEFLGDAVVEFITSIHLFHIFRDLEEGGLATYRAALVQNQHLAVLAKKLNLDEFMLYAHGSDLCHDLELKHAMANCFEALMGALFLDGGIEAADHVFGNTLYGDEEDCLDVWFNYPPHPLQEQEPLGDRKWIPQFPLLQKLTEFEETTGIEFKHIRLLARAFTDRSVGYTNLTLGSNQRMEFLGDSVLQLIASEYLYKYFPEHHEGHLSLLRSSLVNNKTQSVVCDDLGMTKYAVYANPKVELKVKDRADLLEAFLGALYVDNGLEICQVFCDVCFFPRLQIFIMNQDWNDPKSKLQQCCLTLRTMDNVEPDIPIYKVVECKGPTNTRVYTVAVYFRNKRLAKATGHSIQQAEMNAAQKAMETSGPLFPQLDHQKRVIAKSLKTQKWPNRSSWSSESLRDSPDSTDFRRRSPIDNSD